MVGQSGEFLPRFDVDVILLPEPHRLGVNGIVVVPPSATPRGALEFMLRTDVDGLIIEVLDPPSCRGPVGVRPGEQVPNMAVTQRLEADLTGSCPPDVPLVLSVRYECGSEENRRWLNLTSEFSFSSYYASAWVPTFGYRRGTGTFRYSVPQGMVVKATGDLEKVDHVDDRVIYSYVAGIPSVFDFVAGPFTVQRREGRVPVSLYHLGPLDRAEEILARTERIISVLESEFGPYPFDELAVVEAPMGPAVFAGLEGGAYPGYFLIRSDLLRADSLEDWVVGHELTHFWFPHVVGHKQEAIAPAMLDEALAHYGALRVVEALGGPSAAERFRRDGGRDATRLTAAGFDHRLAGASATESWDRVAYNLSNTKGHLVYDMLARTIGRERFQTALQRVLSEHSGSEIGWIDFWHSIQEVADQPLDWFSNQWLESPAIPVLWLEWSQEGDHVTCAVAQSAPPFRLDVPLQVEFSDGSARMYRVELVDERTTVELETDMAVHEIRLDPHFTILHATPASWAEAEARCFVTRGRLLWDDDEPDRALEAFRQGLEVVPESDEWGIECLTRLHIGWMHQEEGRLHEASAEYELALACAIRPADFLPRLYLNIARIAREREDHGRLEWAARSALTTTRSSGSETQISREAREMLSQAHDLSSPKGAGQRNRPR